VNFIPTEKRLVRPFGRVFPLTFPPFLVKKLNSQRCSALWGYAKMENDPTDWSTSYSRYLTRSAALSARTLKLYHEALECVSQGKMPPTIFQDYFPRFAQAHAAVYAASLAGAGARFFSELVRLGAGLGQPQSGSEPEIVPPRFDATNPVRWFEQFAEYAGQLSAHGVKTYRAQLDRVAAGETTPSEVQQNASDFLSRQLPEYLQRTTQVYFDLLNTLNDVRASYEETYFRGVLAEATDREGETPVALSLSGPPGATVSASLSVTNTTGQRARVAYRMTEVRRPDGVGRAFVPSVTIFPESMELGPEEEGTITISLRLDPQQYDPDALYTGTLYVTGGAGLQVEVQVRIVVHPVDSANPAAQPPS
jgi:hypothetical protein